MDEARYPLRQVRGFRPQGGGSKPIQWSAATIARVRRLYAEGNTQPEIARHLGIGNKTVWRLMGFYGIETDRKRNVTRLLSGPDHPNWKGAFATEAAKRKRK